jgi:hypothetical protein
MADLTGMMQAAAGGAGGAPLDIQEVFSTTLYTGTGAAQTITNGIDLDGEGGLVWIKARTAASNNCLFDTDRGALQAIYSDNTLASGSVANTLTAFNSDGFSLGTQGDVNASAITYVSWTFRKAPKFFDIVTFTGTGSARTVSHNLGSVPGCIIVKCTSTTGAWPVYHRANTASGAAETDYLQLNSTNETRDSVLYWNDTAPTDSVFTVGTDSDVNASGETYVAYLWAHDSGGFVDGTENGITCGSYTGNGLATGPSVTLGYEPQWLMIKRADTSSAGNWYVYDSERSVSNPRDDYLRPNSDGIEAIGLDVDFNATSFQIKSSNSAINANTNNYIYISIRAET